MPFLSFKRFLNRFEKLQMALRTQFTSFTKGKKLRKTSSEKNSLLSHPDNVNDSDYSPWFWAPIFFALWISLFLLVVKPSFFSYPEKLLIENEENHIDEFIGERAEQHVKALAELGVKLAGTTQNDLHTLNFIRNEIKKIKSNRRTDLYDIDIDIQHASGQFELWDMAVSYDNVPNLIVKLSPRNSTSNTYLLMNAHFDTAIGSPGAGDDGVMVAALLETLRVISRSTLELKNPIVFLFNGAEEAYLLAAQGFITQHRWAANCRVVINLDSAGSGGREVLFQTGPNNPWLIKYYKENALHPSGSTIAEELFQNGFIPSDTDFRIFRDYGQIPGLDLAHTLNGYIYHTKYDDFDNLESGTYQTTGDNILSLARALANSDELRNITEYAEGSAVFYDFLGKFLISYPQSTGSFINLAVSLGALIVIPISIFQMNSLFAFFRFGIIVAVQVITVAAAFGLTLLLSFIMRRFGLSQSWYSKDWLSFGLYVCPVIFILGRIPGSFIFWTKYMTFMTLDETIACFMHAHCLILAVACLMMNLFGIRSAFFPMIAVFFYTISVILSIVDSLLFKKKNFWRIHIICQIPPYLFYTFLHLTYLKIFIPIQGRNGPESHVDFSIAGFSVLMTMHFAGFIIPVLHKFKTSKLIFTIFGVLCIASVIIARTPLGFPYKPEVSPQRFYITHTNRVFRDFKGNVVEEDSGFYIQPQDTRFDATNDVVFSDVLPKNWTELQCEKHIFCGVPMYSTRWMKWIENMAWIPAGKPKLTKPTKLQLVSVSNKSLNKWRYEFDLKSIDRIIMYIKPESYMEITDWSFDTTLLERGDDPPYVIYHVYAGDDKSLRFWIEIEGDRDDDNSKSPALQICVSGHYYHHSDIYTKEFKNFLANIPDWAYPTHSVASYDTWYF